MLNYLMLLVLPLLIIITVSAALIKKKKGFDLFVSGSKEGISLFLEIFPTMLAMLTAVSLLRACGIIDDIALLLGKVLPIKRELIDIVPLGILRPVSGSASIGMVSDICKSYGPDSNICRMSSSIVGSTDTTIYILSLYFGSIGVVKWRHALKAGLLADLTGFIVAIVLSILIFGI